MQSSRNKSEWIGLRLGEVSQSAGRAGRRGRAPAEAVQSVCAGWAGLRLQGKIDLIANWAEIVEFLIAQPFSEPVF